MCSGLDPWLPLFFITLLFCITERSGGSGSWEYGAFALKIELTSLEACLARSFFKGFLYFGTEKPVVRADPICHEKVVSQDRWSVNRGLQRPFALKTATLSHKGPSAPSR